VIIPTAVGSFPNIASAGNPVHGGALPPAQTRPSTPAPGAPPEPGQDGAPIERAAEEGANGRVAEGDAASTARNDTLAEEFSPQELKLLEQLKQTDRAVRQHEMAHQVTGGRYTGSARYDYEIGPDGQRYAVAGRVSVDYGPITGDPKATVEKMQTVIAAALAPADPSPTDYQIAARARQNLLAAQLELSQQQQTRTEEALPQPAADEQERSVSEPGRDPRVEDYSRIAATTGAGAGSGQAILRSLA
jgi:hypothetical protein